MSLTKIAPVRFEDRISVKYEIEPETLDALVPNLVLQPIVENAMRHGFGNSTAPGELKLQTKHDDLQLTIGSLTKFRQHFLRNVR